MEEKRLKNFGCCLRPDIYGVLKTCFGCDNHPICDFKWKLSNTEPSPSKKKKMAASK